MNRGIRGFLIIALLAGGLGSGQAMAMSKRLADDLTRLIETANAPIFGIDTLGKVTEWNAVVGCEMFEEAVLWDEVECLRGWRDTVIAL